MPNQAFHGCFGRFAGDASQPINFHSDEWTLVRSKKRNSKKKFETNSKCNWKFQNPNAKIAVNQVVAPKQVGSARSSFPKLKKSVVKPIPKKVPKSSRTIHLDSIPQKDFQTVMNQILKNDAVLDASQTNVINHLRSIKKALKRNADLLLVQKALYRDLLRKKVERLPKYWNQQWISANDFNHNNTLPLTSSQSSTIQDNLNKIDLLRDVVGKSLLKVAHLSEANTQWNSIVNKMMKSDDAKTINENLPFDDDLVHELDHVHRCYDSDEDLLEDWNDDFWLSLPRPERKCRKIGSQRVSKPDSGKIRKTQHKLHLRYLDAINNPTPDGPTTIYRKRNYNSSPREDIGQLDAETILFNQEQEQD